MIGGHVFLEMYILLKKNIFSKKVNTLQFLKCRIIDRWGLIKVLFQNIFQK